MPRERDRVDQTSHLRPVDLREQQASEPTRTARLSATEARRAFAEALRDPTSVFVALVFAGGVGAALAAPFVIGWRPLLHAAPLIVVAIALERFELKIFSRTRVSVATVAYVAIAALHGPFAAASAGLFGAISSSFWRTDQRKLRGKLFNLGEFALGGLAAGVPFAFLGGAHSGAPQATVALAAVLSGAALFLVETALLSTVVSLATRRSPFRVWLREFAWLAPHDTVMGLIGYGLAYGYAASPAASTAAIAAPLVAMRVALKQYLDEARAHVQDLAQKNAELQAANESILSMHHELDLTYRGTLEALIAALDVRDKDTGGHSTRVASITGMLAVWHGVKTDSKEWNDIHRGALLHDVGKIGVRDAVLRKPGKLTEHEWGEMRAHASIGYEVLKDVPFLAGAAEIVRCHHERWDGQGYPRGLRGEQIPLGARLFSVVDAFDAMTSDRPYRRAMAYEEALDELRRWAGTQFDPEIVELMAQQYLEVVAWHRQQAGRAGVA